MNVDKTEKTSVKNSLLNKKNMKTKQNEREKNSTITITLAYAEVARAYKIY